MHTTTPTITSRLLAALVAAVAITISQLGPVHAATNPGSTYFPLTPTRLLDTRVGTGAPAAKLGPGASLDLTVAGVAGVPASGVTAVALNVTATDVSGPDSYITVFPAGTVRPVASNLNVKAGRTSTNMVKVAVPASGKVTIYNNAGSVSMVADINGWYSAPGGPAGGTYGALPPSRVLDTRTGLGFPNGVVFGGQTIDLKVTDVAGVPASGVSAVVLNVTAIHAGGPESYLTVFPSGTNRPLASNLNFLDRQVVPNLVVARVGTNGAVSIYNNMGLVHIVADVEGFYFSTGSTGTPGTYHPLPPARDLDTRYGVGTGGAIGRMGPGQTLDLTVTGVNGVPAAGVKAVVLNVTAVDHLGPDSYLTVFPTGTARPVASNLNFVAGETIPNLVVVPVGAYGRISLYNNLGAVDVAADIQGWFAG